jgi:hypothetical protein
VKPVKPEKPGKPGKPEKPRKPRETVKEVRRVRLANVHRFAEFNERTGEFHFDSRWWYRFVVYPATAGRSDPALVNLTTVVPPANITVTPPVVRVGQGLPLSPAGAALAAVLDGMDVEHHWLPGQQVDWRTGNPVSADRGPASNGGAFVAAVCARLKVPMPAPAPENFLPGRQHDWLIREGRDKGWVAVGEVEAQLLANQGWVVVAAWKDTPPPGERAVSGQTAVVRPDRKPAAEVLRSGPRVIAAGTQNHNDIALGNAFPAGAWDGREVVFLAHRPG